MGIGHLPTTPGRIPAGQPGNLQSPNIAKQLSPDFLNILEHLGIHPKNITNIHSKQGTPEALNNQIQNLQYIQLTQEQTQAIQHFGLTNIEAAIVLQSEDEIQRIKKRLKEIEDSKFDKKTIQKIAQLLGLTLDWDTLIFKDKSGGLLIIQSSVKELKKNIEEN